MRAIVRTQGDDRVPPLNLHDESVDVGDRAQVVERRQPARTDDRLERARAWTSGCLESMNNRVGSAAATCVMSGLTGL